MSYFYRITFDEISAQEIKTNEIPNMPGMKNMLVCQQEAAKVNFVKCEVAANGGVPYHKADNAALILFTAGSGTVSIQEENGETTEFDVTAGDIVLYIPPMKLHAYQTGSDGLEYFAVALLP